MTEFKYINDKLQKTIPLDDLFNQIKDYINSIEEKNKQLIEENKKIKDEKYAEDELASMQRKYNQMKADYYRGFPISEKESAAILNWQEEHLKNKHNVVTTKQKLAMQGAIGGIWDYKFIPTSVGIIGTCICPSCYEKARKEFDSSPKSRKEILKKWDAEFEFQEL